MLRKNSIAGCLGLLVLACHDSTADPGSQQSAPQLPALEDLPFERLGGGKLAFERLIKSGANAIYVVDVSARRATAVMGNDVTNGPALSPDGQRFAFTAPSGSATFYDVYVANADGTGRTQVTALSGQEYAPTWSADGSRIVFASFPFDVNAVDVYTVAPRAQGAGNVPARLVRLAPCGRIEGRMSVASDGRVLMSGEIGETNSSNACGPSGIFLISADGGKTRPVILRTPPGDSVSTYYAPAWSPNESRLAYLEVVLDIAIGPRRTRVWTANADGTSPIPLATLDAAGSGSEWSGDNNHSLAWSPDGQRIAFTSQEGDLVTHIYVVNADGSGLTRVTSAANATDRSISWVP